LPGSKESIWSCSNKISHFSKTEDGSLYGEKIRYPEQDLRRSTFESITQAFELVKAWLLDGKEVDDLPQRRVRRYGF
jgi:hypothetical protein